jgi:nucleoside-diphosphate-sugar epimerase
MAKVLVTGGTGFIGRHTLAPLVAQGHEVHATGSRIIDDAPEGVTFHATDLLDQNALKKLIAEIEPQQLIHLAWYVEPGKYVSSYVNHAWIAATMDLLTEFKAHGGKRAVLAGTCFEYEFGYDLMNEDSTPANPNTLYGQCKNILRQKVSEWSKENGIPCAWGRIFYLYGPHEYEKRLVAAVITNLLRKQEAPCSEGLQIRDFMHVQDVADAFAAILASDITGTINIASGADHTIRDIVDKIAEFTGQAELLNFGAFKPRPGDPPSVLGDTSKMTEQVGWTPKYDLHRGIEDTVDWWKGELNA